MPINWYGMIAPAKTPEKIVATLNRIANEAMADFGAHSGTEIASQAADRPGTFHPKFTLCPR
jgi:tripartite-type tricarboxylate transporter receptor subunit TctC